VLTGLTLGGASIIAAFFPLCGLPAAITGLVLGLYGFYMTSLRRMAFWGIVLSTVGLILACINTVMLITVYIGTYMLQ
jgi:cytochrome b subunit of formate dehydrogenase